MLAISLRIAAWHTIIYIICLILFRRREMRKGYIILRTINANNIVYACVLLAGECLFTQKNEMNM